jgi:hypothetical protein
MIAGHNLPRFHNLSFSRGLWSVVLSGVLISGSCWLSAADEAPSAGLRGILPTAVPSDLTATIATLPDNWKEWGDATNAELSTLYEKEGLDVGGQRKAIADLRKRIAILDKHSADPRYRPILYQLVSLSGGLKRRLDMAEAALDTLERGPAIRDAKIADATRKLSDATQAAETYLKSVKNGGGWATYLQLKDMQSALSAKDASPVFAAVSERLNAKDTLPDEKMRDFLSKQAQLVAFEDALENYVAAQSTAVVAANSPELRKSLTDLVAAVEQYEQDRTSAGTAATRKAFEAVRGTAPDGGDTVSKALRNHYFNYNLRIVASEPFLNKFFGQARNDNGPVRDFILGADVYGNQTTHTDVGIELIPSSKSAQFDIVARGAIASNTQGVTDRATVFTYGNHYFTAAKRINYDGERFWTSPARINVSAHNTTTGADTHMGILSGIGNRIAVNTAEGMRGESEAIAASRVQDRVLPEFNRDVDKQFGPNGKANADYSKTLEALRELKLYPDAWSWSSTSSELRGSTRLMTATELGGNDPNPALFLGRGLTVLIHESMMNNAADTLELAGQTLTEDELNARLEANFSRLLNKEVKLKKEEKPGAEEDTGPKTIVFDKTDPIRVQIADGVLTIILRAGFKQEGKDDIPTQIVSVPMTFSVDTKSVVIEPGRVSISAASEAEDKGKQLASAGVIKKKVETAFPRKEMDRVSYVTVEKRKVLLAVTRIRALDGWLSITYE